MKRDDTEHKMKTIDIEKLKKNKTILASIAKANRAYRKATKAQRRVLIAKDALAQLNIGVIKPAAGFAYLERYPMTKLVPVGEAVSLQVLLHSPTPPECRCCARGALFVSAVRFRNDCEVDSEKLNRSASCFSDLPEFTPTQADRIECAYERFGDEKKGTWSYKFLSEVENKDKATRLALILKNIIRNKGTFRHTER
jgi:hypothetical protein